MVSKSNIPKEGDNRSIHLEIIQHRSGGSSSLSQKGWGSASVFEPQREGSEETPTGSNDSSRMDPAVPAPEKKLTLFALRLAILEKAASGLGTLGFIWATVVLLGGFAITLEAKDFWFITIILLVEGARIFSRSHELEWQHQATSWSLATAGRNSFRAIASSSRLLLRIVKAIFRPSSSVVQQSPLAANDRASQKQAHHYRTQRTWHSSEVLIFPYVGWVFVSENVSRLLGWLQLLSAAACVVLSLMRLIQQDYGEVDSDSKNRKSALNIFYGLALSEALVFLIEKAYWTWKIGYCKLREQVCRQCELAPSTGMVPINRFFYDSYSRCIEGSIFDGLKMDLVSFAEELLVSDSRDEQLNGARILEAFVKSNQFSGYTLRKIGTSTLVIERLIEMLNWKNPAEEEIRRSAAVIVSKLAGKKQNAIRVTEIPGSMESISSLLYTGRTYETKPHEVGQRAVVADRSDYEFSAFNLLGLLILKKLARDHENCWKIGAARGLVPKIIDFTNASQNLLRNDRAPESQIKTVKLSLQLVKMLAGATGQTGEMLRKEISEIVFSVSNIREILQYGESHIVLQKLGIEILTSLATDKEAREKIGRTGGVIRLLMSIFFQQTLTDDQKSVSVEAGEALAVLAFDSSDNCSRVLEARDAVVGRLVGLLDDQVLQVNSSRILRNLCAYSSPERFVHLRGVIAAAPDVLKAIMFEKEKLLEVSLGLATQLFRFTTPEEFSLELGRASIGDEDFAKKLIEILKRYKYPEVKVPRIRSFVIEVAIWMMKSQESCIQLFKNLGAKEALKDVAETTSELECFSLFSGSVGLCQNEMTISSLVDTALELMA
ncbi:uncharacterized protein M6B38_319140 [Iris pallida]|uniref:Uncharacterized protein n=1 Tax=Iris pallida TaxID=29817 RepID=A0AAX6HD73_IRIPA|nr:uncharacterized protein M6B38_197295 [Iris pallida]KAJ6838803.1 uncharacterized protein M6B38_319140 [Iris pallida]